MLLMLPLSSVPHLVLWSAAALGAAAIQAPAQDSLDRRPGEPARVFAARVAPADAPLAHAVIETVAWRGGAPTLLAFYAHSRTDPDSREPGEVVTGYAYVPAGPSGRYRRVLIGRIEAEGGAPEVRSVFLARADADTMLDVVVLVEWPVRHYDVTGRLYGTYVYRYGARDAAEAPGGPGFTFLQQLSDKVSGSCACEWRDGRRASSRFTTAAEVRRELARLRRRGERGRAPGAT